MISYPSYYHRQYRHDLPSIPVEVERLSSLTKAALPLLGFVPSLRKPLSLGFGLLRNISSTQNTVKSFQQRKFGALCLNSLHSVLGLSATALTIAAISTRTINPTYGLAMTGIDDLIYNVEFFFKERNKRAEHLLNLAISSLYLSSLAFGHIEILAACLCLQTGFTLCKSRIAYKKGNRLEALIHLIVSAMTFKTAIPQIKVSAWKWRTHPTLEGVICRNKDGYTYVKVDDKIVFQLNKILKDTPFPPYFGKGKYGAHITLILNSELPPSLPISEVGQKVGFTLAACDTVHLRYPNGIRDVSILSVVCPELDALRIKYGLTPKVHWNDFHITLGIRDPLPIIN